MSNIKVTPVKYRLKGKKRYKKGIEILNRNINTFTLIDIKTLKPEHGPYDWYETLEHSEGNIYFNLK